MSGLVLCLAVRGCQMVGGGVGSVVAVRVAAVLVVAIGAVLLLIMHPAAFLVVLVGLAVLPVVLILSDAVEVVTWWFWWRW